MRKSSLKSSGVVLAPYTPDEKRKPTVSMEGLRSEEPVIVAEQAKMRGGSPLYFSVEKNDGKQLWTIYFVTAVNTKHVNTFVHLLLQPQKGDTVLIHAPSSVFIDDAEVMSSAVMNCEAEVIISAPYILDTGAAYFATSGNKMVPTSFGVMRIGMPTITAFGKITDSVNAINIHKYRIRTFLKHLRKHGFIQSDEELGHIVEHQGTICLHGERLVEVINKFNEKEN